MNISITSCILIFVLLLRHLPNLQSIYNQKMIFFTHERVLIEVIFNNKVFRLQSLWCHLILRLGKTNCHISSRKRLNFMEKELTLRLNPSWILVEILILYTSTDVIPCSGYSKNFYKKWELCSATYRTIKPNENVTRTPKKLKIPSCGQANYFL